MFSKHMAKIEKLESKDLVLQGKLLAKALESALEFNSNLGGAVRNIPMEKQTRMFNCYKRCVVYFDRAGGTLLPKNHMMFHLLQGMNKRGHPSFYHTYMDESLNGVIARIARHCHRRSWDVDILYKISIAKQLELSDHLHW